MALNPYSKLANVHSDGLEFVIKKLSRLKSNAFTDEQIIDAISDFLVKILGDSSLVTNSIYYAALCDIINKSDPQKTAQRVGDNAIRYINEIRNLDTQNITVEKIADGIEIVEAMMWSDRTNQSDINSVLLYASFAKSSVKYWGEQIGKGTKSIWVKTCGVIKKIPWRADAEGAIEAAVESGIEAIFIPEPHHAAYIGAKIVGKAIFDSVKEYIEETRRVRVENATAEAHKPVIVKPLKQVRLKQRPSKP